MKLHPAVQKPQKTTERSVGYDLTAVSSITIKPGSRELIPLGISLQLPLNIYGRISPRSGLAVKHGIDIGAGVLDSDYLGEVKVLVINNGTKTFMVTPGMKIAQIILQHITSDSLSVLASNLARTPRGKGGFGSTDKLDKPTTASNKPSSSNPVPDVPPPIVCSIDTASSALPSKSLLSDQDLKKIKSGSPPREEILDLGDTATIPKSQRNKTPIPHDNISFFGDVMHCDIVFGNKAGLQGIKYAFFFIDRAKRMRYIYPLQTLQSSKLTTAYNILCMEIGRIPSQIITDFDPKTFQEKL
eukprot:15365865-Ditylum_brightwellii.AAC.3